MRAGTVRHGALAVLSSIPWCCVVPAALSIASLGGTIAARLWLARVSLYFLPIAALFLGRAFWLMYVRKQGSPTARRVTWIAATLSVVLWIWRFWPIFL